MSTTHHRKYTRSSEPGISGLFSSFGGRIFLRIRITLTRVRIQLFTLMRIRIQPFTLMRIRIRILLIIKGMGICDHWSIDHPGLRFEPPGLHYERPWLCFGSLKLLNSNADPVQAQLPKLMVIHSDPNPQPFLRAMLTVQDPDS
jgi:hypothetical protein